MVTAISGDIGNGILKILHEENNCRLFGCDVNELAVGMDLVEVFWKCKYADEAGYIEELLEKCKEHGITHLIPVNEREIEVIGNARECFRNIGVELVMQSEEVLQIFLDKYCTVMFLKEHGFDVPATWLRLEDIRGKGGKYICKPRKSNGSKNIFVFHEGETVSEEKTRNCVLQEFIESEEEYTVGVFCHNKNMNVIAFKRELKNGYSNKVEFVEDENIDKLACRLVQILKMEGYFNIQLRKAGGKYYIFEVNPRISGTVRFRHMLGFCDVLWWLDILDGKAIWQYKCPYRRAVGIRELNEKYLIKE